MKESKAVLFYECGNSDKLKIEMVPDPEPGRGQVRVRMMSVGLNRAEVAFVEGTFPEKPRKFPSSTGCEGAGIVDKIGEGVNKFKVGDKVAVLCNISMADYPTNKEECIFPEYALVKIIDGQSFADASATWLVFLTAYFGLVENGKVKANDWVVITAASSSAGLAAIQVAKAYGAKVIATSRTSKKKDQFKDFNIDGFVATDEEDIELKIMDITKGKGAKIIYDCLGDRYIGKLANATATRGIIIEYGKPPASGNMSIPYMQMFAKYINLKILYMEEYASLPEKFKVGIDKINSILPNCISIIGKVFQGIESIPEAYKYLEKGDVFGKTVVEFQNVNTSLPSQ